MNKSWFNKDKLLLILLFVSVITVSLVGLYYLKLLTSNAMTNIFQAVNAVLVPFVIAFFLSFIIGPMSLWLHTKLRINHSLAIAISILTGIIFILLIIGVALYFIVTQLSAILNNLLALIDNVSIETVISDFINTISTYFSQSDIADLIAEMTQNGASVEKILILLGSVIVALSGFASSIVSVIMIFVLTPVFMYYLIKEKELIFTTISKVAPKAIRHHVVELGKRSDIVIRNYFKGQGIMMLIIFTFFSIALGTLSFFIPDFAFYYALVFALLMGLFNFIPYLGAWLGLSAPIVFLLTKHLELQQTSGGDIYVIAIIIVLIIHLIEQALEGSIIQPNVLGKQVHIHPLAILSALIFFGGVFGLVGVLLAVPLAGTIKAILEYFGGLAPKEEPKKKKSKPKIESKESNQ
jgi:putative permease